MELKVDVMELLLSKDVTGIVMLVGGLKVDVIGGNENVLVDNCTVEVMIELGMVSVELLCVDVTGTMIELGMVFVELLCVDVMEAMTELGTVSVKLLCVDVMEVMTELGTVSVELLCVDVMEF